MTERPADELASEVEGIREEYRRRSEVLRGGYSFLDPTHARLVFEREAAILGALGRWLPGPLDRAEVLDVGSSSGTSLALLAAYGADPGRLHGVDIDPSRVEAGKGRFPSLDLRFSDGMTLPFPDASFDLVQQITMLSSVHSDELRRQIAAEMLRVLRPGGLVLSYDAASVALPPRLLNRALGLGRRRAPVAPGSLPDGPPESTVLRQIRPVNEADLRALFASLEPLEMVRLSPYRPLVERLGRHPFAAAALSVRAFATAVLYVGRAPSASRR